MSTKLDEMQKKLDESRARAERDAAEAAERARREAAEAAKPKGPTPQELEIQRLNALLAAEREKAAKREKEKIDKLAAEKELKRQEELEAYRRKHYPEFYGLPANEKPGAKRRLTLPSPSPSAGRLPIAEEPDNILDDEDAIDYFDDEPQTKVRTPAPRKTAAPKTPASKPKAKAEPQSSDEPYIIPVEVKGRNSNFRIPEA